jgi:hypothetical protein
MVSSFGELAWSFVRGKPKGIVYYPCASVNQLRFLRAQKVHGISLLGTLTTFCIRNAELSQTISTVLWHILLFSLALGFQTVDDAIYAESMIFARRIK